MIARISLLLLFMTAGCAGVRTPPATLVSYGTIASLGAGQGIEVRDGFVYLFGDAETGIIRECRLVEHEGLPALVPTGRDVRLTRFGEDVISHPTGLTHHPRYGTFLGDTVAGRGRIFLIDWERALRDGNLDHAVLNSVEDDIAVRGSRPEFVRVDGRWYVASSDYGETGNQVRLYDPAALARAQRTSEPGVLRRVWPCGPWVQSLHWWDAAETLVLVQNQIEGLQWRLTATRPAKQRDLRVNAPFDDFEPQDELEGFHRASDGWAVFLSASRERNVWIGRWPAPR